MYVLGIDGREMRYGDDRMEREGRECQQNVKSHHSLCGEETDVGGELADRWHRSSKFNLAEACREFTCKSGPSG